jgi:hypothetical protein
MITARQFARRFWVSVVLLMTSWKVIGARVLPLAVSTDAGERSRGVRKGLLVKLFAGAVGERSVTRYGLETTGTFPYVKVIPVHTDAVPVPLEVAVAPTAASVQEKPQAGRHSLSRRSQPSQEKPFCLPADCSSCSCCPECGCCSGCSDCC